MAFDTGYILDERQVVVVVCFLVVIMGTFLWSPFFCSLFPFVIFFSLFSPSLTPSSSLPSFLTPFPCFVILSVAILPLFTLLLHLQLHIQPSHRHGPSFHDFNDLVIVRNLNMNKRRETSHSLLVVVAKQNKKKKKREKKRREKFPLL
ncbi:hypothetical protein F5H01DRAFT_2023 [Linnemannia elongata]|nr:hypothetical protein F5H01DRAFT_2023 [Linnemannia elongata]